MNNPTKSLLIALSLPLSMLLQGCSQKPDVRIVQEVVSPDGFLVATIFNIKGDATVPLCVDVYLGGKGDDLPDFGNVFRGNHSEKASVRWVDNKNLVITTDAEVFLLMKEYMGVTFELQKE